MMLRGIYLVGVLAIATIPIADIWMDFDYGLAANISLTYIAILVSLFTLLYGLRSRWDSNLIGRTFFTKCCFMSLVLWQTAASSWAGDYPHRDHIRFVIYSLGAVAYLPMVISLWREQQRDRRLWRQRDAMLDALTPAAGDDDSDPVDPLDPTARPPL